jgi:hypothetical protein
MSRRRSKSKVFTKNEALHAFGMADAESYLDGAFFVGAEAILCFLEVDRPTWTARPDTCKRLDFIPLQRAELFHNGYCVPPEVTKIYVHSDSKPLLIKRYHLHVRRQGDRGFLYLGPAGMYASAHHASFILDKRLSRELWCSLGGYDGWLIRTRHESEVLPPSDIARFDQLLKELAHPAPCHLGMSRYEGNGLSLHVNARAAWVMYVDEHTARYPLGDTAEPTKEVFSCDGCDLDFYVPKSETIPLDDACQIARHLFLHGSLPVDRPWTTE